MHARIASNALNALDAHAGGAITPREHAQVHRKHMRSDVPLPETLRSTHSGTSPNACDGVGVLLQFCALGCYCPVHMVSL